MTEDQRFAEAFGENLGAGSGREFAGLLQADTIDAGVAQKGRFALIFADERLIDRAKAAKCSALVLTMDLQILGQRHKDVRNGLTAPPKITPRFVAEMMVKPGWGLRMLGTNRRTFRNIAGHIKRLRIGEMV